MNDETPTPAETDARPAAPIEPAASVTPGDSAPPIPPGLPAHARPQKTNVLAIIALIAGFLVPLAAFICGGIALSQIKRSGDKGRGLAWSGIIVGAVMSVLTIVVSILIVVATAAAVQSAVDTASQKGSVSAFQKPGCQEIGELVVDISEQMGGIAQATGAERIEAISEMQELSAEAHALAVTIDDPEVADAAENAVTALDDVVATLEAASTDAPADPGSAYDTIARVKEQLTALSAAMTELETACR
ncbi:DUF4190 domain-containing protein [Leifsonia sp. NPDC014704]|uniref:DUF4190 domain-containing protein n=1 Tax=Leifsonia sp. NPDC014704 TaxID=3364123 RepID=UPI0036F474B0